LRITDPRQLCNTKSAARSILQYLPKKFMLAALDSLRPLDEVDYTRIQAWRTLMSMPPVVRRSAAAQPEPAMPTESKSAAQLIAELEDSDSCDGDQEFVPQRLMLVDAQQGMLVDAIPVDVETEAQPPVHNILHPASGWEHTAKTEAVIVVIEVGLRPARLTYTRCHREARRQLLLQGMLVKGVAMPGVVRVAMRLVAAGSLPPLGECGRSADFIRRCRAALQAFDPSQETVLNKLSVQDQALIRRALSGDDSVPYQGCLTDECLAQDTEWETVDTTLPGKAPTTMSRCARCKYPKAFGRTIHSVRDILSMRMALELGHDTRNLESTLEPY